VQRVEAEGVGAGCVVGGGGVPVEGEVGEEGAATGQAHADEVAAPGEGRGLVRGDAAGVEAEALVQGRQGFDTGRVAALAGGAGHEAVGGGVVGGGGFGEAVEGVVEGGRGAGAFGEAGAET
jgi:hypothetical protein